MCTVRRCPVTSFSYYHLQFDLPAEPWLHLLHGADNRIFLLSVVSRLEFLDDLAVYIENFKTTLFVEVPWRRQKISLDIL